jgi:hypothetical protein
MEKWIFKPPNITMDMLTVFFIKKNRTKMCLPLICQIIKIPMMMKILIPKIQFLLYTIQSNKKIKKSNKKILKAKFHKK